VLSYAHASLVDAWTRMLRFDLNGKHVISMLCILTHPYRMCDGYVMFLPYMSSLA
jgi:hypothetical protein